MTANVGLPERHALHFLMLGLILLLLPPALPFAPARGSVVARVSQRTQATVLWNKKGKKKPVKKAAAKVS